MLDPAGFAPRRLCGCQIPDDPGQISATAQTNRPSLQEEGLFKVHKSRKARIRGLFHFRLFRLRQGSQFIQKGLHDSMVFLGPDNQEIDYPWEVNQHALKPVGTPHAFPHLLMSELIIYSQLFA